ncbi:hypothetical protein B0T16DRAFT_417507 [Cercophora newfieldiana]|uniref:Uncharacterized protein n=1 Tax=Cercophora newfieldiana TaxID=92897 RepID=A0AA39Y1K4_9PEZI|nr:hypothetical protein B0T16DRAFT_417507 [Cercophora newfieldiana]
MASSGEHMILSVVPSFPQHSRPIANHRDRKAGGYACSYTAPFAPLWVVVLQGPYFPRDYAAGAKAGGHRTPESGGLAGLSIAVAATSTASAAIGCACLKPKTWRSKSVANQKPSSNPSG